jgi:hypothetical protein
VTPVSIPGLWKAMVLITVVASGAEAAVAVDNVASAGRHVSPDPDARQALPGLLPLVGQASALVVKTAPSTAKPEPRSLAPGAALAPGARQQRQ